MSESSVLGRVKDLRARIVGDKKVWGHEEMLEALADAIAEIEWAERKHAALQTIIDDLQAQLLANAEAETVRWEWRAKLPSPTTWTEWGECSKIHAEGSLPIHGYEVRALIVRPTAASEDEESE